MVANKHIIKISSLTFFNFKGFPQALPRSNETCLPGLGKPQSPTFQPMKAKQETESRLGLD